MAAAAERRRADADAVMLPVPLVVAPSWNFFVDSTTPTSIAPMTTRAKRTALYFILTGYRRGLKEE